LVLELVVGDAHDLEVGVEVGRPVVDEAADAVAEHHVLTGEGAQLAAAGAEVRGALEHGAPGAEPLEGIYDHGLEAGQLGVENGGGGGGEGPRTQDRAAGLVERGAAAVHGPANDLHAEGRTLLEVEG